MTTSPQLNATYLGKFYLPTIESEAMYDNTVNARTPGFWVEVVFIGRQIEFIYLKVESLEGCEVISQIKVNLN